MLPPLGALIIGPCPQCQELVLVFCGRALALNKTIMGSNSYEERRDHLLEVLNAFLEERVGEVLEQIDSLEDEKEQGLSGSDNIDDASAQSSEEGPVARWDTLPADIISEGEQEAFVRNDLPLLDDRHYFHTIFG
ncbi:MAG TPA: hypothetical protein PLO62_00040 [Candidatus Hydrogenedentes bacterium]|nr:hypothetical protein [Candidatus Hydrogenedentota bacterium]HOS04253.1 hypothetical protein [Candidatus Hydrogenedentota bacterium]